MRHGISIFCFLITIIFPSIVFAKGAFFYTANEGGSISKVDALSNKLIKNIKLEGVVHNVQISPNGENLGGVLIPKMASHGKKDEMAGIALLLNKKNDHEKICCITRCPFQFTNKFMCSRKKNSKSG